MITHLGFVFVCVCVCVLVSILFSSLRFRLHASELCMQ